MVARLGFAATDDAPPGQRPLGLSDHGALLFALPFALEVNHDSVVGLARLVGAGGSALTRSLRWPLKERPKLGYTWANVWPGTIYA